MYFQSRHLDPDLSVMDLRYRHSRQRKSLIRDIIITCIHINTNISILISDHSLSLFAKYIYFDKLKSVFLFLLSINWLNFVNVGQQQYMKDTQDNETYINIGKRSDNRLGVISGECHWDVGPSTDQT